MLRIEAMVPGTEGGKGSLMADRIKDVLTTHYSHYSKIVRSGKWGWAFRKTRKAERENRQMEERFETLEPLKCKFPGQNRKRNKNIHRTKPRDVTHVHWPLHLTCDNNIIRKSTCK